MARLAGSEGAAASPEWRIAERAWMGGAKDEAAAS